MWFKVETMWAVTNIGTSALTEVGVRIEVGSGSVIGATDAATTVATRAATDSATHYFNHKDG